MSLAEEIYRHCLALPEEAAREALDFIEFLEQRYGKKRVDKKEIIDQTETDTGKRWKELLANMPDVGSDDDFARTKDYGREQSWDI
jgi:hypothetical protein